MRPQPIWDRLNIEQLATQFVAWLPSLFAAALILFFFWLLFRVTRTPLRHLMIRTGFDAAFSGMVVNVYRFTILAIGLVMAASQLGINVGAALAGLGVVGLTIGFAAKDSLSNIMAGFLIFWDKPFRVGDWVTVGDHYGKIAEITMRTTRVQTRDNRWVVIPNATVIDQTLINHSANGATRLQIPVGISYFQEIAKARLVITRAVSRLEGVLPSPAPAVVVNELADSSVNLLVFVWIENAQDEKPVYFATVEAVKTSLDEAGIEIPYPQLEVSLKSIDAKVLESVGQYVPANNQLPLAAKSAQ